MRLQRLPSGRWQADFWVGPKHARKRIRKAVNAATKAEAAIELSRLHAEAVTKHGGRMRRRCTSRPLLELFQIWKTAEERSDVDAARLRRFVDRLPEKTSTDVDSEDVLDFIDSRKKDVDGSTVVRELGTISSFFKWAIQSRYCPSNPVRDVPRPKANYRRPTPPTPENVRRVLEAVKDHPILGPVYHLAAFAGFRRAEIARLQWSAIDGGSIEVPGEKTAGSCARLPLVPELREYLATLPKKSAFVVCGRNERIEPNGISQAVNRWNRTAEEKIPNPHSLRHFCATQLLAHGVPLVVVSKYLRHASTRVTETIYAHNTAVDFRAAIEKGFDQMKGIK